jgi:cell division protein FtsI/penicillin-binding protein 2
MSRDPGRSVGENCSPRHRELRNPDAERQFVDYTAALENGFTAASRIADEPRDYEDRWSHETWTPRNYDRQFKGMVTLRWGLEESRNVVSAEVLNRIGPQTGVDYCNRSGRLFFVMGSEIRRRIVADFRLNSRRQDGIS